MKKEEVIKAIDRCNQFLKEEKLRQEKLIAQAKPVLRPKQEVIASF